MIAMADLTNEEKDITPKTYPTETDFEAIRNVAKSMVDWELEVTKREPLNIVHHPFWDSDVITWKYSDEKFEFYYILEDPEGLAISRERMKKILDAATTIDDILPRIKDRYLLVFLHLIERYMSRSDFVRVLRDIWTTVDIINIVGNPYSIQDLVNIVRSCNLLDIMDEEDYNFYQRLPEELTIYRGFIKYSEEDIYHISWTLDLDVAISTVKQLYENTIEVCVAYEAKINKKDVLAYFSDRNDSTILVDPDALYDVKEIEVEGLEELEDIL